MKKPADTGSFEKIVIFWTALETELTSEILKETEDRSAEDEPENGTKAGECDANQQTGDERQAPDRESAREEIL